MLVTRYSAVILSPLKLYNCLIQGLQGLVLRKSFTNLLFKHFVSISLSTPIYRNTYCFDIFASAHMLIINFTYMGELIYWIEWLSFSYKKKSSLLQVQWIHLWNQSRNTKVFCLNIMTCLKYIYIVWREVYFYCDKYIYKTNKYKITIYNYIYQTNTHVKAN